MMKVLAVFYVLINPVVFSVASKLLIYEVNLASLRKIKGNLCRVLPFATMKVAFYRHIFSEKTLYRNIDIRRVLHWLELVLGRKLINIKLVFFLVML